MVESIKKQFAKGWPLVLLLAAACLGNFLSLELFFGADFLFGSIAVLLAVALYGLRWGVPIALIASAYTWVLWDHPWAIVIFTLEALLVGVAMRRFKTRNILVVDTLYWVLLGMPLGGMLYGIVLNIEPTGVAMIVLKQGLNGVFNALVAGAILILTPLQGPVRRHVEMPMSGLRQVAFMLMAAFVFVPTVAMISLECRDEMQHIENDVRRGMKVAADRVGRDLDAWYQRRLQAVGELARQAGASGIGPGESLQQATETVVRLNTDFLAAYVADIDGQTIAYYPPVNERGECTIGINFADRAYFQEAMRARRPTVSDVMIGRGGVFDPIQVVAAPVLQDGNIIGVTAAAIDLKAMSRHLHLATDLGDLEVTLFDRKSRVLVSTSPGLRPMEKLDWRSGGTIANMGDGLMRWSPDKDGQAALVRWAQSSYVMEIPQQGTPGTRLLMRAPLKDAQIELYEACIRGLTIALVVLLLAMALAWGVSNWLDAPLRRLARATTALPSRLSKIDSIEWPSSDIREIDTLIGNCRQMAGRLQVAFDREQAHGQELASVNQDLHKEILLQEAVEAELRESREKMQVILENLGLGVMMVDGQHRVLEANGQMREWFPVAARACGTSCHSVLNCDRLDTHCGKCAISRAMQRNEASADLITYEHGGEEWHYRLFATPVRSELGRPTAAIVLLEDITAFEEARSQQRRFEQRYQQLIENSPAVTWMADLSDQPSALFVSPQIRTILGYEPDDFLNSSGFWLSKVHPEDIVRVTRVLQRVSETERWDVEYRMIAADGRIVWVHDQGSVIRDESGEPSHLQGMAFDITEQKQAEEQLQISEETIRQLQKLEAVGRLAGGIAHDFNNVLTGISGYAQLALEEVEEEGVVADELGEIVKLTDRAAGLTRQLLAFSRKQTLQPTAVNLTDLVQETTKMLARLIGEDVKLSLKLGADLAVVEADPGQMQQVLMNLAVNARDAMPDGGELVVETANFICDETTASRHGDITPGDYVMLTVTDTGCGMDAETLSRIFEPFFTTKEVGKGTGLGLATVYGIVRQHGGHVWVYSEPGMGTTFKVFLPRPTEDIEVAREKRRAAPAGGRETVLVVEDEPTLRNIIGRILAQHGYQVLLAADADEAEEVFAAEADRIDMLLTDVVMPGRNGRQLYESLSRELPGLKVLFMSGYTDDTIMRRGIVDLKMPFMQKPFTPEGLARRIREVLDATAAPEHEAAVK